MPARTNELVPMKLFKYKEFNEQVSHNFLFLFYKVMGNCKKA